MKRRCFTDVDCLEVLVEFYINYHGDDEYLDYEFQVSKGNIYYFKKRHGFVSNLCHIKGTFIEHCIYESIHKRYECSF